MCLSGIKSKSSEVQPVLLNAEHHFSPILTGFVQKIHKRKRKQHIHVFSLFIYWIASLLLNYKLNVLDTNFLPIYDL